MFFESFIDELEKIALDISMDPKKFILQKQYEELAKGMKNQIGAMGMGKQQQQQQQPKQPSVVYHVKVRPDGTVRGENRGPAQ